MKAKIVFYNLPFSLLIQWVSSLCLSIAVSTLSSSKFLLQSSFLMRVPLFEMLIQFAKVMTKKLASPYLVSYPTLHQESDK